MNIEIFQWQINIYFKFDIIGQHMHTVIYWQNHWTEESKSALNSTVCEFNAQVNKSNVVKSLLKKTESFVKHNILMQEQ